MRLHPISLALMVLRGRKTLHGVKLQDRDSACELLKTWTGQDFGYDPDKWGKWLQAHRRVYRELPSE